MSDDPTTRARPDLATVLAENQRLRAERDEAQETLRAIREGEVDAIVVSGSQGDQVFSLTGAESVYRAIVETMQEAALTVTLEGTILSGNPQAETLLRCPASALLGRPLEAFVAPDDRVVCAGLLVRSLAAPVRQRLVFQSPDGTRVPTHVSAQVVPHPAGASLCLVATDLRTLEASLETLRQVREQEAALQQRTATLAGISQIFQAALTCETEAALGGACLAVAERLTQSQVGVIGTLTPEGLEAIATSIPGWGACQIHGLSDRVIRDGQSLRTNDPTQHPDGIGLPAGHPPLTAFLGVPLTRGDRVIGLLAVADRADGYTAADQEVLEALAPAVVEAFLHARAEIALRASEAEFRAFFDSAAVGTAEVGPDGRFARVNDQLCALTGFSRAELGAMTPLDLAPPDERAAAQAQLAAFLDDQVPLFEVEKRYVRKDGRAIWVRVTAVPIRDAAGRLLRSAAVIQDITARRQAEAALQKTVRRFYEVLSRMVSAVLLVTEDNQVEFANQAFCDAYGLTDAPADLIGLSAHQMIDRIKGAYPDPDTAIGRIAELVGLRQRVQGEEVVLRGDCTYLRDYVPLAVDGESYGRLWQHTDITARTQAEAALRESHATMEQRVASRTAELSTALQQLSAQAAQVRSLASELTLVEQRERVRLAGVLHDGLQQLLVAAKLRVLMLERGGDPTVRQSSQEIGRLLEEAIAAARSLTAELSPPLLRTGGLLAGLPWLARWVRETHHLTVQVVAPAALPPVPEDVTILLFQAARELLFNAVKYAQVAEATVLLACEAQGLTLTVTDAGAGFDPTGLRGEGGAGGGFGLATIRHRLELLGGCMQIASAPGHGTRVTLAMRLPTAAPLARLPER